MSPIAERFIQLANLRLHVREAGSGQPIIMLHGITASAAVWDPVTVELAKNGHAIAVSQRGHGQSDLPELEEKNFSANAYARDIIELIEHLGASNAVLVGHSLGARNALTAAMLRPDLISAVVALDFTPFIEKEVFDRLSDRVVGGDRVFQDVQAIETYLQDRYPFMPADAVSRRANHGYVKVKAGLVPRANPIGLKLTAEGLRAPLETAVASASARTIIVRGQESTLVTETAFEKTISLRPELEFTVVPGSDHYVVEEQPEAVTAIVRLVLERGRG